MTQAKTRVRFLLLVLPAVLVVVACQKQDAPSAAKPAEKQAKHDCDDDEKSAGPPIELGTAPAGGFSVRATRDQRAFKAGCDAPIDVWITAGTAKVAAVRFWIGTQDAKGSIKAKAGIEHPAEPNRWHTHVEIPDPIPAGSKLWVEIEADGGATGVCSFDLKA